MKAKKITSYKKVPIYQCKNKYFAEVDNTNVIKDSIEEVKNEVDKIFNDADKNEPAQLTQADFSKKDIIYVVANDKGVTNREYWYDNLSKIGLNLFDAKATDSLDEAKINLAKAQKYGVGEWKIIEMPRKEYNRLVKKGKKELDNVLGKPPKKWAKEDELKELDKSLKFSQAYKVADLPFTFLKRKQMGVYTIFDCEDCQIKIKTDTLDKNNSLVKVKNFSEDLYNAKLGNAWLVDNDDYIGFEDNDKPKVALQLKDLMEKCSQMKDVSLDKVKFVKVANFADNNWQDKFVSNLNAEIDKQGLGEKLTVTIDNTGNIVLANVETEDELVVTGETEPSEYQKFLMENGLVLDENNIENFSQINFGLGNWLEKMAVKGLTSIASKGQQKALMAVCLGYAMKRYEQALEAIQATIDVAPKGAIQGHLRRMLLNGEMPKGLSKLTSCPGFKGLEEYKQVMNKVAGKLNNSAAVQAYKNAKDLDDQMPEIVKQGKEIAKDQEKVDMEKLEDEKLLGQEGKEFVQKCLNEFGAYKKEHPDIVNKMKKDSFKAKFINELAGKQKGHKDDGEKWTKKTAEELFEKDDAKSNLIKLGIMTRNGTSNDKKLNDIYNKLSKTMSAIQHAQNRKDHPKEDKEKEEEKEPEMVNNSYKGFSEELNDITSKFTTEFFAEKVRDSEFGICYQDRFGSLWSADPDTNKDATLLWKSKDGQEVPTTDNSDDAIMDESEMDDTLGMESEEDNGGDEFGEDEDFDFGDESEEGEESGDDLDFGDEESEESDDLGFSEDEDFDFGDEEGEDEFDFEDEETEEETTSSDENISKMIDVVQDMYSKLYELAKNK